MLSIKMFLKCILITGILYVLIMLRLVADKHLCHYCHLHPKAVIFLGCMLMLTLQWTTEYSSIYINTLHKDITSLEFSW